MTDELPPFAPDFGRLANGEPIPEKADYAGVERRIAAREGLPNVIEVQGKQSFALFYGSSRARLPSAPLPDLRAWRLARGWSQFELAKRLGKSLSTTIRWETKTVPEIKREWLRRKLKELEDV